MAQILKGAPVVAAMNEANAARCAALKERVSCPHWLWCGSARGRMTFLMKGDRHPVR